MNNGIKCMVVGLLVGLGGCYDDSSGDGDQATTGLATDGQSSTGDETMFTTGPSSTSPSTSVNPTTAATDDPSTTADASTGSGGNETSGIDTEPGEESGSSSGGTAELTCDAYCSMYMDACQDYSEYANAQHCLDHCNQWPVGDELDVGDDSLGCRIYHATVASTTDPSFHCPHSGPSGEATCIAPNAPTCDLYCTRYFNNCEGDLNAWADMDACLGQCAMWYPGSADDTSGHSTGCRSYYANLAVADPEMHCPAAGPGGADICVL